MNKKSIKKSTSNVKQKQKISKMLQKGGKIKKKTSKVLRKGSKKFTQQKMKGGMGDNSLRLPLESNVSATGDGTQLGNDIINLVFSSINTITDTIATVVDVVELSSNMGSEFSSPFAPGA